MRISLRDYPPYLASTADAIQSFREEIKNRSISASTQQNVIIDGCNITLISPDPLKTIKYLPEPTPLLFHTDSSLVRLIMGPYGSGKSSCCIAEIILRAASMPFCIDGTRHYGAAIIRNTYAELETTTLKSWDNWTNNCFETILRNKKPPIHLSQRFRDDKGIVEIDLLFLSLDRPEDIKKVKSLERTDIFINEACEIPFSMVSHLLSRTGRYPTTQMLQDGQTYSRCLIMDTNPPDTDHPIYQVFEIDKPEGYKIFKQPPAVLKVDNKYVINPLAENIKHHTQGASYYLEMIKGATEEYINVFAMGKYGLVMTGKPVFPQYNDDVHSTDDIKITQNVIVKLGWDFGLTPACLVSQKVGGQVRHIKEFCTDRMGVRELAESVVLPWLRINCVGMSFDSVCDPSGVSAQDGDEISCIQILASLGLPTRGALTNAIVPRIEAVNFYLNRLEEGRPAFILSRTGCPILRKAFLGKYGYKRVRILSEEKYRDVPDKAHPFSDIQDCGQYICLDYTGEEIKTNNKPFNTNEWANNSYSSWV